jgi:hypothetical protein
MGVRLGGRQKGTPNKTTKVLKDLILGALDEAGGQTYLVGLAHKNPQAFAMLLAKVLPTQMVVEGGGPVMIVTGVPRRERDY